MDRSERMAHATSWIERNGIHQAVPRILEQRMEVGRTDNLVNYASVLSLDGAVI